MEKKEEVGEKNENLNASPDRDDSLADFKSPKLKPVPPAIVKPRILNDKRAKKSSSKSKTAATSRKKENAARRTTNEQDQPSIQSSFFRASVTATKTGHTCPLCMRYFADTAAGTAHSKNCATKNNVSTKKLLAAVALQERQSHERIAIGLPAGPLIQPKTKTPRRNRDPVVSNADPDLQLALALSESLQENELEQEFEEAFLLAAEHRGEDPIVQITHSQKRQTLKNFGFSTNKPATSALTEGPTKSRRKKLLGPTVLQTRTKESRDRILSERIAEILMGNEAITQASPKPNFTRAEKSKSKLQSRLLSKIHQSAKRLWYSAQLSTEITNFYVDDLGPVVLPCTDRRDGSSSKQKENHEILESKGAQEDYPETLHEKAPEIDKNVATNMTESPVNRVNETGENSPPETRNIYVTDRQYRNNLAADWSNTLNVSSMSDVVILVKSTHIWAHKLVFHVRCSNILLDCEPTDDAKFGHVKEKICWLDLDSLTAMAFLEFVYSGVIERNPKVFDDNRILAGIRRLARKYRLKDLFDYLRKTKPVINCCTSVENRREGLSSPIIVDAKELQKAEKEIRENRAEKIKNQPNDTETHETKEIRIKERKISRVLEVTVQRGGPPDNIASITNVESSPERFSPCRKLLEVSAPMPNSPGHEIDNDREIELMEVISIASSHRASTMSPDLFDETIDESREPPGDLQNMETSSGTRSQVSLEGDSNLKVLAQLIADDISSSDETDREFPSPTSPQSKRKNKTAAGTPDARPIEDCSVDQRSDDFSSSNFSRRSATESGKKNETQNSSITEKMNDRKSLSQSHLETPKSRGMLSEATDLSKSQRLPDKQKSNLSLFIEKIQKINSKPAEDSDSEAGESFGFALDRRRFRNPFNVNNVSNEAVKTCDQAKTDSREIVANEESNVNESSIEESLRLEENDDIESTDDTFSMCDENLSMYSKYKKKNSHNNSISNYRNMLKKVNQSRGEITANCEKSESDISTHDVAIDLTQESDDDIEFPASSTSSVNPRISRKPTNRILDTDSNDSSLIRIPCQGESSTVIEKEQATASKNCSNLENSANLRNSSLVLDRNDERNKTAIPSSSLDDKNSQKNSMFLSDIDVFEIDEELLSHSNSHPRQVASSKNSSPLSGKSTPRLRNDDEPINNGAVSENSLDNENNLNHFAAGSSEDTRSPNSFAYRDSNELEANEEIFTQSLLDSEKSAHRNLSSSPHFKVSRRIKSSASKRKSDAMESETCLENLTTENEDQQSTDERGKESLESSPEDASFDLLEADSKVFTQSSKNVKNRARKTSSSRSTCNEGQTPRKAARRRSKKRFKKRRSSETSVSSADSQKTEERKKYDTHELSPEVSDSKISRRTPEPDFPGGNEEIFSQSLKSQDENSRATTPSSSQETLRIRSPILLSSSPELGTNAQEIPTSDGRDSDKENSQKSNESFVVSRHSQDDLMDRFSPVHLEELYSPEPCTSRPGCSSRYDYDSSSSVRKLTSRSISMPESTLASRQIHARTETPQKRSRITMSQEFTPPRNYDEMDTPELKRELDRYGIKPQKRKRARQLLNHIYNELHRKVPAPSSKNNSPDNAVMQEIDEEEPPSKRIGKINDRNSNDSESDSDVPLSQESLTSPTTYVIPEEMEFPEANISPREMAGPISIKEAFLELMNVDKKLHTQVLTYEPLPFETLFSTLKAQGLKCKKNDLMDFLDEECITFRILAQSGKNRTRKKGVTGSKRKDKNHEKNKVTENPV